MSGREVVAPQVVAARVSPAQAAKAVSQAAPAPSRRAQVVLAGHAALTALVVAALVVALVAGGYTGAGTGAAVLLAVGALVALSLLAAHRAAVDRRRLAAPGTRAAHLGAAGAGLGVGAGCWLVWLALPAASGRPWPSADLGVALPGPTSALVGAAVSAVVLALVLAAASGSILAPLGAGAGLWLAHALWLFGQDDALWAFAAALALPVAIAVALACLVLAGAAGLVDDGASHQGVPQARYDQRPLPRRVRAR